MDLCSAYLEYAETTKATKTDAVAAAGLYYEGRSKSFEPNLCTEEID